MRSVFVFNEMAVVVHHWFEVGMDDEEHGARLEVRELQPTPTRESSSASQLIIVDQVLLRVDIFDLLGAGEKPGNLKRSHFHTRFLGNDPVGRQWDTLLSADPATWLSNQLADLQGVLGPVVAGTPQREEDLAEIRAHADQMVERVSMEFGERCTSPATCRQQTRHAHDAVLEQMTFYRPNAPRLDPRLAASHEQSS